MKKIKSLAALLIVCLLLGATACKPVRRYTVSVSVDGKLTAALYDENDALTLDELQKDGFEFLGYFDENGVKAEFPYIVTRDVTLTARWQYGTLANNLADALGTYLQSEKFAKSVAEAKTSAAWLPLSYLRYVEGDFYTDSNAALFKKYLNMIDELLSDGEIKDGNWSGSAAAEQGWYGILDYLYTYSIAANAYKEYLHGKGLTDTTVDIYDDAIARYLEKIDNWESGGTKNKYEIAGQQVYQVNLASWGNNWKYFSASRYDKMPLSTVAELLAAVAQATGSDEGHKQFIDDYTVLDGKYRDIIAEQERIAPELQPLNAQITELNSRYRELNDLLRNAEDGEKDAIKAQIDDVTAQRDAVIARQNEIKQTQTALEKDFDDYFRNKDFLGRFNGFMPITQVAFGMTAYSYLAIVKANLGLNAELPYTDSVILSYYEKDENGEFTRKGGTPNWVGPTGRPVAASLYRDSEGYDVNFEKYRQGYFPFTDGWNQPLEEMITLDTLGKYYNHDLGTGANVTPQWGLLTGYMHGIDMENYTVAKPVEGEPTQYNIISLWRDNLATDGGKYVIDNNIDMAVAIAYLAYINGTEAPTPFGVYSAETKVINL